MTLYTGDALAVLRTLPAGSVNCCVTSPPYFQLRDYDCDGQIGMEDTPELFVARLVEVFREVRRVLADDGVCWVNLGDSYNAYNGNRGKSKSFSAATDQAMPVLQRGHGLTVPALKNKDLIGIPWMFAFAARADGWFLRQEIIWAKTAPMPESVTDRCVKSHEHIFLLTKSARYFWDHTANQEPAAYAGKGRGGSKKRYAQNAAGMDNREYETRTRRSVWTVNPVPYPGAHFATYPPDLIRPCIAVSCPPAGRRCDCDELIATPVGTGAAADPSKRVGRAGMSRPRRSDEGTAPVTRREQRWEAAQIKSGPYAAEIKARCGPGFDHYVRTDASGARPLPPDLRAQFHRLGWLTPAPPCVCEPSPAGVVLDPFAGSGTTLEVAVRLKRRAVGIELNPEYGDLIRDRMDALYQRQPGSLFADIPD